MHQGNFFSHPRITKRILKGFDDLDKPATVHGALTARELDVLQLVASGYTNREIADILTISDRTVSTHVSHILGKMGVDNRIKAAMKALSDGLIELDEE